MVLTLLATPLQGVRVCEEMPEAGKEAERRYVPLAWKTHAPTSHIGITFY